tara:strand:+ start:5460 stop:6407 length:948 start_codon:yes stop_codon:yes gene_type:complete
MSAKDYGADSIKVLEGLEGVRKNFDVIELSRKIKKKGDVLILSKELKIRPRILGSAVAEGRVLRIFPEIQKSKASILASLKTDREIEIFLSKYLINELPARKLIKLIRKWNDSLSKDPRKLITQKEHDLILGTLMGDAYVRQREKNSCLRFSHSLKQKDYSKWKSDKLKVFGISECREVKRKINERFICALDFATKTHPVFNYYRNLFYGTGKKVITKEILDQLTPRGLAIWICDDGSYSKTQDYIILCTNSFSLEEHELIKKFFNDKFGLDPTIGFRDGKYYYLRFKKDDTQKLIKIIKPFLPQSMLYKIGESK